MSDLGIPLPDGADGDVVEGVDCIERTSVLAAPATRSLGEALDALASMDPVSGLAPLVRWAPAGDGVSLVHRLPLGARALTALRADGPLRLGAAAALGRGIVEPVRALHSAGLAHGAIGADGVLLAPDGTPVLAGTGLGWAAPPGHVDGPDPAADVAAIAELVRHLVGATPLPSGLVLVLLRCCDDDPRLRPTLDDLDRALAACLLVGDEPPRPAARPAPDSGGAAGPAGALAPDDAAAGTTRGPSFLERPPVLRPVGGGSGRRLGGRTRPRRSLALVGAALVGALLVARAAAAPAVADGPREALPLRSAAVAPSSPSPAIAAAGSTPSPSSTSVAPSGPLSTTTATPPSEAVPSAPSSGADPGGSATRPAMSRPSIPERGTAPVGPASATAGGSAIPSAVATAVDWVAVLTRLDQFRHAALVAGSRERLARAVDPAGPAWAADAALADRVRDGGARLEGGQVEVLAAEPVSVTGRAAELAVVDTRAAYAVTLDGATARVPARGATTWTLLLARAADGGWRIHDVRVSG